MCTVSILMPVKNTAAFLEENLQSIQAQSFMDWELIAVDDHSSDDSLKLLTNYSKLDSRIKVFQNEAKGIIPALRLAYSKVSGKFITRMDSDDYMSPDKIKLFYEMLKSKGHGHIAVGLVEYISATELGQGYIKYADWLNNLTLHERNYAEIYKECSIPSPNWMVYREDFERAGAVNENIYPEDYDLAFRFREAGLKITAIKETTHFWRDHSNRASRNDINYQDNSFIPLKIKHYLAQDYKTDRVLVLWGAGGKGKKIAKALNEAAVCFEWICNNKNKIGHSIHGVRLKSISHLSHIQNPQLIIAIGQKGSHQEISETIKALKSDQVFFFC